MTASRCLTTVLLLITCLLSRLTASEYFLAPDGDDGASGSSEAQAWGSFWHALGAIGPGDTLTVLDGTYNEEWLSISQQATAAAPITIRAKNRWGAVITPAATSTNANANLLHVVNASHIVIDGLKLRGIADRVASPVGVGHGIAIEGSHHITVRNCWVEYASGSGISGTSYFWDNDLGSHHSTSLDHIIIENNRVGHCAWYNTYQTSGISLYQAVSAGLGTAASGYNIIIRNNVIWGCENKVNVYGQAPGPGVQWDEWTVTDGNGIIIDDFRCDQGSVSQGPTYPHQTLVENNLVVDNGGRGVHVYLSDHVTVRNNTSWGNGWSLPGDWKGQLSNVHGADNHWYNNIAVNTPNAIAADCQSLFLAGGSNDGTDFSANLVVGSIVSRDGGSLTYSASELTAVSIAVSDAGLVDPGTTPLTADFSLTVSSPALDSGDDTSARFALTDLAGTARPQGAGVDIGAYERSAATVQRRIRIDVTPGVSDWTCAQGTTSVTLPDGSTAFGGIDIADDARIVPAPTGES